MRRMNPTTPEAVADGAKKTDGTPDGTPEETHDGTTVEKTDGTTDEETDGTTPEETDEETDDTDEETSGRLAAASAAVVSAGLGVVGLTGAWSGRVAAERETLIGQIKTSSGGSAAQQINEIGDAWHATALVNGLFGLLALLVGGYVLVRPAFGAPARQPQAGWVRAVARGGLALGALGVLISVAMYFDLIVAVPATGG
ncbi:hypothetical protein ACFUJY_20695 [Streptomyces sp. NPDC057249]|uniref:hypothetical protein n=1 Tax=Streptomyces sp. NPDC057249 TaxID=3346067 RepID=UPI003638E9B7